MFASNAAAATSVIDNDPLSSAPGYHQYEGSWSHRSGGYNSDHRYISSSDLTYASYTWIHESLKNTYATYGVYLYNATFTNTRVAYQMGNNGNRGYINQDTAYN